MLFRHKIDNIQYEWNISGLHAISQPLDGFSNIIRKIDWNVWAKLEVSGQTYAEFIYGDIIFDISNLDLNSDTFISYEDLTLDNVVSWIEENNPTMIFHLIGLGSFIGRVVSRR